MTEYISVSLLTKYLKKKFDQDPYLEKVYLTGEISNFRLRPNHQYFSLKDDSAVINVTMFAGAFKKLNFQPENGMKVMLVGRVSIYEKSGQYQINAVHMIPDGVGALALQFEQLKKKLAAEGLFNPEWKQTLPQFSNKIGVVTSPSGAVIRDIITTIERRFPMAQIILFPSKVQGDGASEEISKKIKQANDMDLDVLIVGRGGGSIEDLWPFNEEEVVRAIFESKIPVISSVGHETDTTLADFVADRRAATPTAAAELASPISQLDLLNTLNDWEFRMKASLQKVINNRQEKLDYLTNSVIFRQPERLYDNQSQKVDQLIDRLENLTKQIYQTDKQEFALINQRLRAIDLQGQVDNYKSSLLKEEHLLQQAIKVIYKQKKNQAEKAWEALTLINPENILARGYSLVRKQDKLITSVKEINPGDLLELDFSDGKVEVEVKNGNK